MAAAFLPDELIMEILSWLPVKSLMKFRCVNKFFKTVISNPQFVEVNLKKSVRNPHLTSILRLNYEDKQVIDWNLVTFPISRLLENQSTSFLCYDPYYRLTNDYCRWWVVGSCNGLLCLIDMLKSRSQDSRICFWNPATRTKSEYLLPSSNNCIWFAFGYDTLAKTYKVVAFCKELDVEHGNARIGVKIFSMGNNSWRNIQCFPMLPLDRFNNHGVYLSGTINWLALRDHSVSDLFHWNDRCTTVKQCVILSLDLSSEKYTQLLLPRDFDKVPRYQPKLVVLMGRLCFYHDFEETHFVIWQMKDFGAQESWIQLLKISYSNFFSPMEHKWLDLLPLYLSENGDTLILANDHDDDEAFIYNCRDNRVKRIGITNKILWSRTNDYVESLVSTH